MTPILSKNEISSSGHVTCVKSSVVNLWIFDGQRSTVGGIRSLSENYLLKQRLIFNLKIEIWFDFGDIIFEKKNLILRKKFFFNFFQFLKFLKISLIEKIDNHKKSRFFQFFENIFFEIFPDWKNLILRKKSFFLIFFQFLKFLKNLLVDKKSIFPLKFIFLLLNYWLLEKKFFSRFFSVRFGFFLAFPKSIDKKYNQYSD